MNAAEIGAAGTHIPTVSVPSESSLHALLTQTIALTGRQLYVFFHNKATFLQVFVIPVLTMVMLKVVLGEAMSRATGQDAAYGTVPLVIVVSAMFGGVVGGLRLNLERSTGLLARLYVLPINRAADLASRLVAEIVRIVLTTTVLITVGVMIGFAITANPWAIFGIYGVAVLFGTAYSCVVFGLAVNAPAGAPIVQILSLLASVLMFFNTGFAPAEAYPTWLEPFVANQPMSIAINVMRGLAIGTPVGSDLVKVALWAVGAIVIFLYPTLRGYRKAATSH